MTADQTLPPKTKRTWQFMLIILLLAPPWALFLVACYWVFWDVEPPVELVYQHPMFVVQPAKNRDEARLFQTETVRSGAPVWIYREICVRHEYVGTMRAAWDNNTSSWPAPERPVEESKIGCRAVPSYLLAPSSNPSRTFVYRAALWTENNPLTTIRIDLPPLQLRVIAPGAAE